MIEIPNADDWKPLGPDSTGDEGYAYRHFFGKSFEEAVALCAHNSMMCSHDLMYMPEKPFCFYAQAYARYLRSDAGVGDSDGASCFLRLIDFMLDHEPDVVRPGLPQLLEAIDVVARHQSRYDAEPEIYGSFEELGRSIKLKAGSSHGETGCG